MLNNDRVSTHPTGSWSPLAECWLRMPTRFTCTGIGTTIRLWPSGPPLRLPALSPALTRFHLARRFWNQILTCTSLSFSWWAIWDRSLRERYFFEWNSFSSSSSCSDVNAVRRRRLAPSSKKSSPWSDGTRLSSIDEFGDDGGLLQRPEMSPEAQTWEIAH